jgi:hypothetical protein
VVHACVNACMVRGRFGASINCCTWRWDCMSAWLECEVCIRTCLVSVFFLTSANCYTQRWDCMSAWLECNVCLYKNLFGQGLCLDLDELLHTAVGLHECLA